jgi:glycosidase
MPPLETGKKSFIAVNILPSPIGQGDPVEKLQEQIGFAKQLGFTHAWINPISIVPDNTICKRRCLDTGVFSELTGSLYAPNDPKEIRPDFDKVKIRTMGRSAREDNFFILVDFVWKHVSANSTLIKTKPTWFGEKKKLVKDVIEYDFKSLDGHLAPSSEEIIEHLKSSIDVLLDPIEGYGFSGLRIDAASQLIPSVRGALYQHIRARWPKAIIFEEVLFDGAQSTKVNLLVKGAEEHKIYSDFITSNLYYQKSDSFGALPSPETMGDALKLKLADQRGIGFTGNHDHHSLGWGVILTMAAKLLVEKNQFDLADQRVAPFQSYSLYPVTIAG